MTGPYLQSARPEPAWLLRLASALSRAFPTVRSVPIDAAAVSNVASEVEAYTRDPLVDRGGVRLASVRELHALGPRVLADVARLTMPVLVVQGAEDRLSAVAGAERLAATAPNVTLEIVRQGAHDLLHDRDAASSEACILEALQADL